MTTPDQVADEYRTQIRHQLIAALEADHRFDPALDEQWLAGVEHGIDAALHLFLPDGDGAAAVLQQALARAPFSTAPVR